MPNILKDVTLDEISLVDTPANSLAKVVLMKRSGVDKCGADTECEECRAKTCSRHEYDVEKAPAGIQFNVGFNEDGSDIQSVVFDREHWDTDKAKAWLKDHDMASDKSDEKENTLRFRQKDPDDYTKFRMIKPGKQVTKALSRKFSINQVLNAVDAAVRLRFQPKQRTMDYPNYLFVKETYWDSVIFEQDGQTWGAEYTITETDSGELQVDVGEKELKRVVYKSIEPVETEITESLRLRLASVSADAVRLAQKSNECHNPSGPGGGQFCSSESGGKKFVDTYLKEMTDEKRRKWVVADERLSNKAWASGDIKNFVRTHRKSIDQRIASRLRGPDAKFILAAIEHGPDVSTAPSD